MNKKTLWITQTAVLIALLIILQYTTASMGQFITGSCVNAVLAFSGLAVGLSNGVVVAILSPFFAFMLGIGPKLLPIVPCIAAGNLVYVLIIAIISGKGLNDTKNAVSVGAGAVVKFIVLQYLVVNVVCTKLPLKAQQIATFTKMFSWPQLVTAFVGGILAMLIAKAVRKAINKEKNRNWKKRAEAREAEKLMGVPKEVEEVSSESAENIAEENIELVEDVEIIEEK